MDRQGEREKKKHQSARGTRSHEEVHELMGKSTCVLYEASYPNHPNHLILPHCAAMVFSHLLRMADR